MARSKDLINIKLLKSIIVLLIMIIVTLFFIGNGENSKRQNNNMLIPKPASYTEGQGEFILKEDTRIIVEGNNEKETEELRKISNLLLDKINKSTGFNITIIENKSLQEESIDKFNSIILSTLSGKEEQGQEGYSIDVSENDVKLSAYKPEGIFRGLQTLRQLFPAEIEKDIIVKDIKWSIPVVSIDDKPEYSYRGMMIDVARHFFSVEDIKNQIELISQYKINKLHLHLSNDQGWRLEIKKWSELTNIGSKMEVGGTEGGYYTQEEFKEIVEFARERYIEVIPEFDMPGHTNAMLASYDFLNEDGVKKSLYSGTKVGFSTLMCRDEKTYDFIEDIIKEVSEMSPGKYIHIGGDEADKTEKEDYDYFMRRVSNIVVKYNKIPIGWSPYKGSSNENEKSITQIWKANQEKDKGENRKFIISVANKCYLDMKYNSQTPYGLSWAGYNSIENAYNWKPTDYCNKEDILGIEAVLWTEAITNFEEMNYMIYPRLLGYAEIGWSNSENKDWRLYKERLKSNGERLSNEGINFYKAME